MHQRSIFFFVTILILAGTACDSKPPTQIQEARIAESKANEGIAFTPTLQSYVTAIQGEMDAIPADRKKELKKLALYVKTKKANSEEANLVFICTHNSRRSHMSQLWASAAAAHYGVEKGINTYSGGTEVTAFNPRAVAAMERAGFIFEKGGGENPHYLAKFAENGPEFTCWSKKYDDPANPQTNFAAILTCSEADKNCPYIPGATLRSPIKYEDPKEFDGTADEQKAYDERCRQIATEMFFLMSEVKR
jgi:arsenate reductase